MPPSFFINRSFALLWLGQALAIFGEFLVGATVGVWLVSGLLKHDAQLPLALGLTVAASTVPRIVVAPLAGVWVDSARPVRVMVWADASRILATLLFLVISARCDLSPWKTLYAVCGVLLVNSTASQFFAPARAGLMQKTIPAQRRIEASSKSMFSLTTVAIASAALGPVLYSAFGALPAFALAIAGLCGSIGCVVATRESAAPIETAPRGDGYWQSLAAGIRLAWHHPSIRLLMTGTALYGISLGINNPVLPLFGMQTLKLSPAQYGVLMAAFPVGGICATLLGGQLGRRFKAETLSCGGLLLMGLANLCYGLSSGFYQPMLAMYASGLFFSVYLMAQAPVLQAHVPAGYMGRVSSLSSPVLSMSSLLATALVTSALSRESRGGFDANSTALVVSALVVMLGATLMLRGLITASLPERKVYE